MLPKKDQLFLSVPVSRVGLLTRLNQIAGLRPSLRPSTPGAYVTSSLNPVRNMPVTMQNIHLKLGTQEEIKQFEELPIIKKLDQLEAALGDLSQSMSSFKEDDFVPTVDRIISVNQDISHSLGELRKHQALGQEVERLTATKQRLDSESKHILRELISYRATLKKLPRLPSAEDRSAQPLHETDAQTLLDYAMKLAKFSKVPATILSHFVHPNNYIWPAEDALRRGMLAVASLKPDELIQAELGLPVEAQDVEMEDVAEVKVAEEVPQATKSTRTSVRREEPASLDLDLFEEDDDSD